MPWTFLANFLANLVECQLSLRTIVSLNSCRILLIFIRRSRYKTSILIVVGRFIIKLQIICIIKLQNTLNSMSHARGRQQHIMRTYILCCMVQRYDRSVCFFQLNIVRFSRHSEFDLIGLSLAGLINTYIIYIRLKALLEVHLFWDSICLPLLKQSIGELIMHENIQVILIV